MDSAKIHEEYRKYQFLSTHEGLAEKAKTEITA